MIGDSAADVGVGRDKVYDGAGLGLRERVGAGALLVALGCPDIWEGSVEVKPLARWSDRDIVAVIVADAPFSVDAVVGATILVRRATAHQARILRGDLPRAVRVGDPHLEDLAVAVDVVGIQAVAIVGVRVAAGAAADIERRREVLLSAVGVDTWHD